MSGSEPQSRKWILTPVSYNSRNAWPPSKILRLPRSGDIITTAPSFPARASASIASQAGRLDVPSLRFPWSAPDVPSGSA